MRSIQKCHFAKQKWLHSVFVQGNVMDSSPAIENIPTFSNFLVPSTLRGTQAYISTPHVSHIPELQSCSEKKVVSYTQAFNFKYPLHFKADKYRSFLYQKVLICRWDSRGEPPFESNACSMSSTPPQKCRIHLAFKAFCIVVLY